jgi:hypothetical protein
MLRAKSPYLARQMSKWFYDTSSGTATRAACGGSLIGGAKVLRVQARWARWFTWFGPPECNALRPWENVSYIAVHAVQL